MTSKLSKSDERRLDRAFKKASMGNPILMSDVAKAFNVGKAAILGGADDAALDAAMLAFIESVRVTV